MVRVLRDVKRIVIHPTNVSLLTPERFRAIPRDDWNLYIGDIKQIQNPAHEAIAKAVLFMDDEVTCRVYEEEQSVFCAKEPHKMKIMMETPIR